MSSPEAETAIAHSIATYFPEPKNRRAGVALCLSGGGFRAALFHLGGLRRLNELGLLSQMDTISSVSGGSIVAAHLADRIRQWPPKGTVLPDWDRQVAAPLRALVKKNLRTWPLLQRLLPWKWFKEGTAVEALAKRYEQKLTGLKLTELPARPRFIICATDLAFGVSWVFDSGSFGSARGRLGDYQAGYKSPMPPWPVGRAVAASSCFPPVFNPLPVGLRPEEFQDGEYNKPDRNELVAGIRLSDGGVYDNLGLEPVWKDHAVVLVSDGGAPFTASRDTGLFWQLQRYVTIVNSQARALRKRWLISSFIVNVFEGTYWGIGSAVRHYNTHTPGYSEGLVDDVIAEVRTDLDAFSEPEIATLENHGYLLAEGAIQRHLSTLIQHPASLVIPHPQWMDEDRVARALAESRKVRLLGRW